MSSPATHGIPCPPALRETGLTTEFLGLRDRLLAATGHAEGDVVLRHLVRVATMGWESVGTVQPMSAAAAQHLAADPSGRVRDLARVVIGACPALRNARDVSSTCQLRDACCLMACYGGWEDVMQRGVYARTWVVPADACRNAPTAHLTTMVSLAQAMEPQRRLEVDVPDDRSDAVRARLTILMPVINDAQRAALVMDMPTSWRADRAWITACAHAWADSARVANEQDTVELTTLDQVIIPHRHELSQDILDIALGRCAGSAGAGHADAGRRVALLLGSDEELHGGHLVQQALGNGHISAAWTSDQWDAVCTQALGSDEGWMPGVITIINEAVAVDPQTVQRILDGQVSRVDFNNTPAAKRSQVAGAVGGERVGDLLRALTAPTSVQLAPIADWLDAHPQVRRMIDLSPSVLIEMPALLAAPTVPDPDYGRQLARILRHTCRSDVGWVEKRRKFGLVECCNRLALRDASAAIGPLLDQVSHHDIRLVSWSASMLKGLPHCTDRTLEEILAANPLAVSHDDLTQSSVAKRQGKRRELVEAERQRRRATS
jgi:hypothetical protein